MKDFLSGIGHSIKDKFDLLMSKLSHKDKETQKPMWRKKAAGRSAVDKTPVMGAPGAPVQSKTSVYRRPAPSASTQRRRGRFGFLYSIFDFFARKKRLVLAAGAIAAAVLIPVIAVSANANADNTKASNAEEIAAMQLSNQESTLPEANDVPTSAYAEEAQPTPTPEPTPEPKQYLDLEPETKNADVIKLQQRLMDLHYMDNDEPTDYYGPHTQKCVTYFQRKHNLPVDGVAGPATQDLLFAEDAQPYSAAMGSEGDDVSQIQYRLQELGYMVAVTGYFGEDTENNVRYFQRMNGLDDDGSVGQYTKDILFSEGAEPAEEMKKKSSGSKKSGGSGGTSHTANPGSVEAFIDAALSQLGKPYRTAGKGPDSYDCSGFVYYALNASGNGIGYMTSGGWASSGYSTVGSFGDLQRGDVICFSGHVGIYLGGGEMVDASSSNGCVVRRGMGSWARNNFICGKRPL